MRLKTSRDIAILREGGRILAEVVQFVAGKVKPGVTALLLDTAAEQMIVAAGGKPSFKGFHGYPATTCISVNETVVHGIPRDEVVMHEGDIVGIDIGLNYRGLYTDMAVTIPVGAVSRRTQRLITATRTALDIAIKQVRPGNTIGDIGSAVQAYVEKQGYGVVRSLVGHGVGYEVHEEPRIPNFGRAGEGPVLEPGAVLAIEPMVTMGGPEVLTEGDDWTIVTADGSLAAHFEHTVVVTVDGCEILTRTSAR
ncbi:MAG: type I methionyl aminopeptidase [Patescibacteria group bacterium]|nr:type I methionyl aminopeptidase [Patescibacteria group bacterium]MDD5715354.1 type I methionyl aminopeptidase [Patescibacteria group bacterium]